MPYFPRYTLLVLVICLCAVPGCARQDTSIATSGTSPHKSPHKSPHRIASPLVVRSPLAPASRTVPIAPAASPSPTPVSDIALRLPGPAVAGTTMSTSLLTLKSTALSTNAAADWRHLADSAAAAGRFEEASRAYLREATLYRKLGDTNAAQVEELKSARYGTVMELYAHRIALPWDAARVNPDAPTSRERTPPRARLEPLLGCYLGAFIDRDDSLPRHVMQGQAHGDVKVFTEKVGKAHASYFMYRAYGQPFPREWAEYIKSQGAMPHIAWEPRSLDQVADDAYLRTWVEEARRLDWPVFIRFAGEMNGDWTPYHGNPAAYRQAFRRVYQAFRKAPKVALIWCPNTIPENGLDAYYPGDDAVDWVGVNFYSVLYLDNDLQRPGDKIHPTDLLDYVYRKYSARKPIVIAEYAATHFAQAEQRSRPEFAVDKIAQLYSSLPTRYPRVKMVDWYDCDNIRHAQPGRQLNNYLLTDVPEILDAYARAVRDAWFLGADDVRKHTDAPLTVVPLHDGETLQGLSGVQAWVRTYVPHPKVYFRLDGRLVYASQRPDRLFLSTAGLALDKRHVVEVLVYDDHDRFIVSRKAAFELR